MASVYFDDRIHKGLAEANSVLNKFSGGSGVPKNNKPDVGGAILAGLGYVGQDIKDAATSMRKPGLSGRNVAKQVPGATNDLGLFSGGGTTTRGQVAAREPVGKQTSIEPKTPGQVNATGKDTAVPAEASAAALTNPAKRQIYDKETGTIKEIPGLEPSQILQETPPISPEIGPINKIDVIRGTQQSVAARGDVTPGLGSLSGDGTIVENAEFDAYIPGAYDMNTARAAAQADAIRRNVFHRPYDSDAVKIARQKSADEAASDYLRANTEGATDKERLAAQQKLGLATLGVRREEIAGREKVANINANAESTDYKKQLEQMVAKDEAEFYRALQATTNMPEEEKKQWHEVLQKAAPETWKKYMGEGIY